MMLCQYCGKVIPKVRGGKYSRHKVRWCSNTCANAAYRRRRGEAEALSYRVEEYVKRVLGVTIDRRSKIDTEYNGKTVDIKGATMYVRKDRPNTVTWSFNRSSVGQQPDYFLCLCLNKREDLLKAYMIPNGEFPESGVTVGKTSKFDEFLVDLEKHEQIYK
jgi:hypothetical protein